MPEFTEKDREGILSFIREYPLMLLVATAADRAEATQVPVLITQAGDEFVIRGHIMRNTTHHKALLRNSATLGVFTGPQCYVSSGWYAARDQGATWNYMQVQARGQLRFLDQTETMALLDDLTTQFESSQDRPLMMKDLPKGYVEHLVPAIAGFEISTKDVLATFKLSQNRDDVSYRNIVRELEKLADAGAQGIAREMRKRRPLLEY